VSDVGLGYRTPKWGVWKAKGNPSCFNNERFNQYLLSVPLLTLSDYDCTCARYPLQILGKATDQRTNTRIVYMQMTVDDYLDLVGSDFDSFAIQRRQEQHGGYKRLRSDIISGALIPTITLAYDPEAVGELQRLFDANDDASLLTLLSANGRSKILDGLQRTHILSDLRSGGTQFKSGQTILVEFWLEEKSENLIYRIIVLNAGQKPMSMRHQVEVLFSTFKSLLQARIAGLELLTEREAGRRTRSRRYGLDKVVGAYQAFLLKSPEIQKENVVAQRLVEEDVLSGDEQLLNSLFNSFTQYLSQYAELDDEICRVYDGTHQPKVQKGTEWFGNENVMQGFFAAVADFTMRPDRIPRVLQALASLKSLLQHAAPGEDPLGFEALEKVVQGFNTKRVNVGFATRKLLVNSFKEFFREEGEKPLADIWASEAD
jgi:hypothetical protein